MIKNNPTNVEAAFEILLEEIEAEIAFVNDLGAKGFGQRDYEKAKEALQQAGLLTAFREKVDELRREWANLQSQQPRRAKKGRRSFERLRKGLRTRQEEFYLPILSALVELGGSAKSSEVLALVEKRMKSRLKKVDYEPLASNRGLARWENTAAWARWKLIQHGFMAAESPRGVWEITPAGREHLAKESSRA
jgi:hypothetical protein